MKLVLNNFRCFKNATLEIPENGTFLLSGTSGIGKTTIFKAINFVLYGKEQKVTSHGKKGCKVEFYFNDVIIRRSRVPNLLTFTRESNGEYVLQNEAAQKEIDKIFGTNFLYTNYMSQKGIENFFNLSGNEKSMLLQKISLKDFDIESIRIKTRDIIRKRKDKQLVIATQIKRLKADYNSLNCDSVKQPKIKIDLKGKSVEVFLEEEKSLQEKTKRILKEKRGKLSSLLSSLEKIKINSALITEKSSLLSRYDYLNEVNIEDINNTLEEYNKCILYYTLKEKRNDLKAEYDKMVSDEEQKVSKEIERVKREIDCIVILKEDELRVINKAKSVYDKTKIKNLSELKERVEEIDLVKEEKEIMILEEEIKLVQDKINGLSVESEGLKKQIKDMNDLVNKTGYSHKCPKCSISLYLEGNNLKELTENLDEIKVSLKESKLKVKNLEEEIEDFKRKSKKVSDKLFKSKTTYLEHKKIIEEYSSYIMLLSGEDFVKYRDNLDLKKVIDKNIENVTILKGYNETLEKLNTRVVPPHIKRKKDEVLSVKKKYDEIKEEVEVEEELSFYVEGLDKLKVQKDNYDKDIKIRDKLLVEIEGLKCVEGVDESEVEKLKEDIVKKEEVEDKLRLRESKLLKYKEELELYNKQMSVINELKELEEEERIIIRGLSTSELLLKKINEAESQSLLNTIDGINIYLEEFITSFFGDNFSARLVSFKENKEGDKKAVIDVEIIQNGEKVSLDCLSGGEYDRLCLALFLSFNKITKGNIILLDECLASLHSELVEDIVEFIKSKFNDKLILITLHQANTGIFDKVIGVEELRE